MRWERPGIATGRPCCSSIRMFAKRCSTLMPKYQHHCKQNPTSVGQSIHFAQNNRHEISYRQIISTKRHVQCIDACPKALEYFRRHKIHFNKDGIQQCAATLFRCLNSLDGLKFYQAHNCNQFVHHIDNCLENCAFWGEYKGVRSPGEGHCFFLHSLVNSLNIQNPFDWCLSLQNGINAICNETMENSQSYMQCFDTNVENDILQSLLRDYIFKERYDTLLGDLMPFIATKSIGVNMYVIT